MVLFDAPFSIIAPPNRRKTGNVRYRTLTAHRPCAHVYKADAIKNQQSISLGNPTILSCTAGAIRRLFYDKIDLQQTPHLPGSGSLTVMETVFFFVQIFVQFVQFLASITKKLIKN